MSLPPALSELSSPSVPQTPAHPARPGRRHWLRVALLSATAALGWLLVYPQPQPARQIQVFPAIILRNGSAEFSPDGQFVVAPTDPSIATLWDTATGRRIRTFTGSPIGSRIDDLTLSPDGRKLVTASMRARVWDTMTGEQLLAVPPGTDDPNDTSARVERVVFSPDGARFATLAPLISRQMGKLRVYDARSGQLVLTIDTATSTEAIAMSVAYSPDGTRLATGGQTGVVHVWDARSGAMLFSFQARPSIVSDVAFSPDGRLIATANDHDLAQLWDAATGQLIRTIRVSPLPPIKWLGARPHAHVRDWTTSVAFSPDGQRLALANTDATAGVWEVQTGQQLFSITGHTDKIESIAFSPDGSRVVTSSEDRTARVWSLDQGE